MPMSAARACRALDRVDARDASAPGGGPQQGGEDAKQRGLAGAVRAEQGQALARAELEGDAVEHGVSARRSCGGPAPAIMSVGRGETAVVAPRTATRRSRRDQSLMARSRATRSSIGGCVENSVASPRR